jgi:hypothetical protein
MDAKDAPFQSLPYGVERLVAHTEPKTTGGTWAWRVVARAG